MKKVISMHDHRIVGRGKRKKISQDLMLFCSCGKSFTDNSKFNKHQKEMVQLQLKPLGIEVV